MDMKILGLVEKIVVAGKKKVSAHALLDTGASMSSVDMKLAADAGLGPVVKIKDVKFASNKSVNRRVVVKATITLGGKSFDTEVNLQDRSHMRFPVLIGRNILSGNFLIDAEKNKEMAKYVSATEKKL